MSLSALSVNLSTRNTLWELARVLDTKTLTAKPNAMKVRGNRKSRSKDMSRREDSGFLNGPTFQTCPGKEAIFQDKGRYKESNFPNPLPALTEIYNICWHLGAAEWQGIIYGGDIFLPISINQDLSKDLITSNLPRHMLIIFVCEVALL